MKNQLLYSELEGSIALDVCRVLGKAFLGFTFTVCPSPTCPFRFDIRFDCFKRPTKTAIKELTIFTNGAVRMALLKEHDRAINGR